MCASILTVYSYDSFMFPARCMTDVAADLEAPCVSTFVFLPTIRYWGALEDQIWIRRVMESPAWKNIMGLAERWLSCESGEV